MSWKFFRAIVNRKSAIDNDLDEELRYHLEQQIAQNIAAGMSPEAARYAALRAFGGVEQIKEECRDARGTRLLEELMQDLRYGLRQLHGSPGLAAIIVLSLALGIGANTAVFTLVDAVMFKSLPVRDPQQLVLLAWVEGAGSFDVSRSGYGLTDPQGREVRASFAYPLIEQLRSQRSAFSSVFGFVPMGWSKEALNVSIDGQAGTAGGVMVTGGYFSGLGVSPILGRVITDADMKESAPRVAVISYNYWTRRFARAPSAAGKAIFINGVPVTIVGVAPPEFFGVQPGQAPDIWVPLVEDARLVPYGAPSTLSRELWTRPDYWWVMVFGRLKPGVSEQQALAAANVPFLQSAMAASKKGLKPTEVPPLVCMPASRGLDQPLQWQVSRPLLVLMVVVGLVLLIACANIATLLLARATARQREIGVRLALGASRPRLIRQLLTESILLSAIGGIVGFLLAQWGSHALLLMMSGGGETIDLELHPDLSVLGFCAGVSVLTGILFGLTPAMRATRVDVASTLKEAASGVAGLGSRLPLGKVLVIVQVALSLLLLIGAGLFVRTLANLENQNLGFNRHNLLLFAIDPTKSGYEGQRALNLYENVRERLQAVPGTHAVTFSQQGLLTGWVSNGRISIEGYQAKPGQRRGVEWNTIGPDFFQTMGIRLLLGRPIDRRDTASSLKVAVVNEAMARYFFGDANPLGRRFSIGEKLDPAKAFEIVGVVESAKYESLRTNPRTFYLAYTQQAGGTLGSMHFAVRTAGDPMALISAIRSAIREIDPNLALAEIKTQTQQMADALTQERLFARLSSFFGMLALLLASIGLYGLMAYSVTRRTSEIGIRLALGAQPRQVLYMVMRQSFVLVAGGVVAGLLAAFAATRLISSELYGLRPTDPVTLGVAALLMLAVGAVAAYLPARRAMKVDPMVALRYE